MKKVILFTLTLIVTINLVAQNTPATKEQQQTMLAKISEASSKMKSLTCNFNQVKELSILDDKIISQGKMYYHQDNRLRWEYTNPYTYTFILNGKELLMQTDNSRNVIDIKSNRLFQEIVKIMMNSINGEGLIDEKSFKAAYFWSEKSWNVVLTPVQKEVKRLFSLIELLFNVNDYTVDRVKLIEQNGDTTVITLSDKHFNEKIEDHIFDIN